MADQQQQDLRAVAMSALPTALETLGRTDPKAALEWIERHLTPPTPPHAGVYGAMTAIGQARAEAATSEVFVPISVPVRAVLEGEVQTSQGGDR